MAKAGSFFVLISFSIIFFHSVHAQQTDNGFIQFDALPEVLDHAQSKLLQTLDEISYNTEKHPGHTNSETGKWDEDFLKRQEWTSGFFAGSLWYMFKLTGDEMWKDYALEWTEDLEPMIKSTGDHDTGFRIFNSYGNAYKLLDSRYYYKKILRAAQTLTKRYDPEIGAIKSWDWIGNFPVIIDNLMNLELLFWASEKSGNKTLYDIALSHAEVSLIHHMRPDGTSYHIVDFDNLGNVNWKNTSQGYGPNSVWARGQAWAIYGFTMIYRYTEDERFLDAAIAASEYFINNLPDDFIPIYDFLESVGSVKSKDASAAAIAASAFFELYRFTDNPFYFNSAVQILNSLSTEKYSTYNSNLSSILKESTLHRGHSKVGTSYADYYYLEAIIRYKEFIQTEFPALQKQYIQFLDQNYPNPFNNSTIIYYSIENESAIELSIFDMSGRRVQTLVNNHQSPGNYNVVFDGSGLSSGVYIYKLRSNGELITRKMTLIQ